MSLSTGPQLATRQELKLDHVLRDIQPQLQRHEEVYFIMERVARAVSGEPGIFESTELDRAFSGLEEVDAFLNELIDTFLKVLNTHPLYMSGFTPEMNNAVRRSLRLACYLAFVGHFGVERKEEFTDGKPMDYFLHPILSAFYEAPYRVGLTPWGKNDRTGIGVDLSRVGTAIAIILHDLFEDFKKGTLIAAKGHEDGFKEKILAALGELIQVDIPGFLPLPDAHRLKFGAKVRSIVNGMTKPEGSGRLEALLHWLAACMDDPEVFLGKAADRVNNHNSVGHGGDNANERIRQETRQIILPIARGLGKNALCANLGQALARKPKSGKNYYKKIHGDFFVSDVMKQLAIVIARELGLPGAHNVCVLPVASRKTFQDPDGRILTEMGEFDHVVAIKGYTPEEPFSVPEESSFFVDRKDLVRGNFCAGRLLHPYPDVHFDFSLVGTRNEARRVLLGTDVFSLGKLDTTNAALVARARAIDQKLKEHPRDQAAHREYLSFLDEIAQTAELY